MTSDAKSKKSLDPQIAQFVDATGTQANRGRKPRIECKPSNDIGKGSQTNARECVRGMERIPSNCCHAWSAATSGQRNSNHRNELKAETG